MKLYACLREISMILIFIVDLRGGEYGHIGIIFGTDVTYLNPLLRFPLNLSSSRRWPAYYRGGRFIGWVSAQFS
jgi:hypothetical protein